MENEGTRTTRGGDRRSGGTRTPRRPTAFECSPGANRSRLPGGTSDLSTLALWRRCARGALDRDWEELHLRTSERIRRWLESGLSGPYRGLPMPEAEDLHQEVFCRLLANRRRALHDCRATCDGELMAYLSRVCKSVLASAARSCAALKRRAELAASRSSPEDADVPAPGLDPEQRVLVSDARARIAGCVNDAAPSVSSRHRFILDQVLFVGYSSGELSRALGLSASTIDSVISRARQRAVSRGLPFPSRCRRSGREGSPCSSARRTGGRAARPRRESGTGQGGCASVR